MEILGPAPTTPHGIPDKAYVDTGIPQWSNVITYEQYAVTNSAGTLYYSINAANLNHDPVADTSHTYWALIVSSTGGSDPSDPIPQWSSTVTYSRYAITNVAGILYYSVNAANLNHDPVADTSHTYWAPLNESVTSQLANTVFAAPDGSDGVPSFRSLVVNDIPTADITSVGGGYNALTINGTGGLFLIAGSDTINSGTLFKTTAEDYSLALSGTQKLVYDGPFYATTFNGVSVHNVPGLGPSNIGIGEGTLTNTGEFSDQIAIGQNAMQVSFGIGNVAIGSGSMYSLNSGSFNVSIGLSSGFSIYDGNDNTLIGNKAGYTITSGSQNIVIGSTPSTISEPTSYISDGSNNIVIGFNAKPSDTSVSNEITLGNSSSEVVRFGTSTVWNNGVLTSTALTGTAPLAITSTTVVDNLNADLLDGYNTSTSASSGTIPVQGNATTFTTIESTNTTDNTLGTVASGAVQIAGGVGIAKNLTVGTGLQLNANANLTMSSGTGYFYQDYTGTDNDAFSITASSLTTASAIAIYNTDALTSGRGLDIVSYSTNRITGSSLASFYEGGANDSPDVTAYGISSFMGKTGTNNTNVAAYLEAREGTRNYSLFSSLGLIYQNDATNNTLGTVDTGSIITTGGVGIYKNLTVGGSLNLVIGSLAASAGNLFRTSAPPAPTGTDKLVYDGNFYATNAFAKTFTSSIATGTAPLTVTSTTKVDNLNADLLDGYNTSTSASSGTIPVQGNPTTFTTIASSISTGTAPLTVLSTTKVDNLNADLLDGYNTSTSASSGTIPVQGYPTTFTTIASSIATGTAPLTVLSTTKVDNLNADLLDGYNTSTSALSGYIPVQGNATTFTTIASTDATDNTLGTAASGAVQITGGAGIAKNLTVGGSLNLVAGSLTVSAGNLFKTSGTPAPTGTDKLVYDGNFYATNAFAKTFTSSIATGTAPFSVSSTTKVTNLNVDLLDGAHLDTDGTLAANSDTAIPTQKAVKTYADNIAAGLDLKASVIAASHPGDNVGTGATALTITGVASPLVLDGITISLNDRVLIKDQSTTKSSIAAAAQNGIYYLSTVGTGSNGVLTRTADADNTPGVEVTTGMYVFVETGTQSGQGWILAGVSGAVTLGTTALNFTQFSVANKTALDLQSNATTGTMRITGPAAESTRIKTVRDADDTLLEAGGSYTPSGTWTSLKLNENVALTTTSTKLNYLTSATGTTGTTSTNIVFSDTPTISTPTIAQINGSTSVSGTLLLQSSSNATKGVVTITGSGVTLSHLTTAGVILYFGFWGYQQCWYSYQCKWWHR